MLRDKFSTLKVGLSCGILTQYESPGRLLVAGLIHGAKGTARERSPFF